MEATIAVRFPIGILDLKDPEKGSLGVVSKTIRDETIRATFKPCPLSVALGELVDVPPGDASDAEAWAWLNDFQYAKIGLAGAAHPTKDWQSNWRSLYQTIPPAVALVGVAYVDWFNCDAPPIEDVFDLVRNVQPLVETNSHSIGQSPARERVMLLDTHSKSTGSIVDILGWQGIESWIDSCKLARVKLVVAGSLQLKHLKKLTSLAPDLIGFRGAVCEQGRACLSQRKLEDLVCRMSRLRAKPTIAEIE
jgi:uncharacterized protein (UPF0264 family)